MRLSTVRVPTVLFVAFLALSFILGVAAVAGADIRFLSFELGTEKPIGAKRITAQTATPKPTPKVKVLAATVARTPAPKQRPAAPAATPSVWDRLASCESGGNWAYNGPSGFDGGLQFLPSTWRAAGGTRYTPFAYQATREQQIAIASAWLKQTSWAQWPVCSRKLGLR